MTALLDRKQLDVRQRNSAAGLETARRETAGQRCWIGDIWTAGVETARRETVLLDSKQLDWRLLDTQLEWRLLDGRQLDSVAGRGTSG